MSRVCRRNVALLISPTQPMGSDASQNRLEVCSVISCLLLLAACSRPIKTDPDVRELLSQMASLCAAYDNAATIARMDTATGVQGEWHQQADAMCDRVAIPDTLQP